MSEVPDEPTRDGSDAAGAYPPPFASSTGGASDDELAEALAAQTAMYTGPITIPVVNSDPAFRPDPAAIQTDVPPLPAADDGPVLPPVPVPPPPPVPEYVAPDVVAADPESTSVVFPDEGGDEHVTGPSGAGVPSWPAPPSPTGASESGLPPVDSPRASVPSAPPASAAVPDDELSRTIEQEAAASSTLDAILLLENELRRRQGLPPVTDGDAPPVGVGAAFGDAAWDAPNLETEPVSDPPASARPGWTDAPDPAREGEVSDAPFVATPTGDAAPALDSDVVPAPEAAPEPAQAPAPEDDAPPEQAWLSAPPPSFAPPPLVEPPAAPPVGTIDPSALTPPPASELPAPLLPPPVTTVEGPDGPVDVSRLPPPSAAAAVDLPPASFADAPPPEPGALPFAPPPPVEALVVAEPAGDPETEGIDDFDRADLPAPIPIGEDGVASVAPVPVSTATMVAVGEPPAPERPSDPPAMAVEPAAAAPTPLERRAGHAARLFWLWFAANSSIVMVAVGATLFTAGMSLRQVLVAVVAGVGFSALPLGLGSLAGKWSGQPTMVVSRATFGVVGNVLPAILAVIGRVLWGGVLVWLLAATTATLLDPLAAGTGIVAFAALGVGAVLAGLVAVLGYGLLHRVQRVLGILSTVLVVGTIVVTAPRVDIATALRTDDGSWWLVVGGAVTVFSVVGLAWAQSSSDLARYQNPAGSSGANMLWGSFGVILPTLAILSWGAVLAASDPEFAEELARSPLAALAGAVPDGLMIPLLAASGFGLVGGAIVAMYSGGLALVAVGVRMPRAVATLVAAVLVAAAAAGLLVLGADTRHIVRDIATTLAVPVAAWTGIFASEMMIRLRRFHAPSLLVRGGVYPTVRWVNLVGLVIISAVGWGLVTADLDGLGWEGYLFPLLGFSSESVIVGTDAGVLVALALGMLLPLVAGVPAIRRQERSPEGAETDAGQPEAAPLVD